MHSKISLVTILKIIFQTVWSQFHRISHFTLNCSKTLNQRSITKSSWFYLHKETVKSILIKRMHRQMKSILIWNPSLTIKDTGMWKISMIWKRGSMGIMIWEKWEECLSGYKKKQKKKIMNWSIWGKCKEIEANMSTPLSNIKLKITNATRIRVGKWPNISK